MKAIAALSLILISSMVFAKPKISVFCTLVPSAGNFVAVSEKVKGNLFKQGDTFTADKISVLIESFKTENTLRDEHFAKHLNASKNNKAILTDLKGSGGKASANLEVNGVKKPLKITYKIVGEEVVAQFNVKNSQFNLPKVEYLGVGVQDDIKVEATLPFRTK